MKIEITYIPTCINEALTFLIFTCIYTHTSIYMQRDNKMVELLQVRHASRDGGKGGPAGAMVPPPPPISLKKKKKLRSKK
jgi:hypothetical protein